MRRLIFIIIFSGSSLLFGQNLNFIQVDTQSYNQYLRKDWKELIKTGKSALESDINYYYLQMRIAYAYFSLENYRSAIKFYKNALEFNSHDPVANEYLYYCYTYSGRKIDALSIASSLSNEQREDMGIDMMKKLVSFGFGYANSFSDLSTLQNELQAGVAGSEDGVQKATIGLNAPSLNLSHRFDKKVIISHRASMIFKNELSLAVVDGVDYYSPEQPLQQLEYGINADILISEGLILSPGIDYISTSVPVYLATSYGAGAGRNRTAISEVKLQNWVEKIELVKQLTFFDIGLSFVHHNFNLTSTKQIGLHTSFYPKSNLNLYLLIDAYAEFLSADGASATGFIVKPLVGFRVHKNLWLEFSGIFPENFNFYDVRNSIAYNGLEKTVSKLESNIILPIYSKNMKLFLGYQYRQANSYFFPENNILEPSNKLMYNSHLITGGIKWTR